MQFVGKYQFLSNFWFVKVKGPGGYTYPTTEHAYQAYKSLDLYDWQRIIVCNTPSKAKRVAKGFDRRNDWDDIKIDIMRGLLLQKFPVDGPLTARLLAIAEEIVEGNSWGDEFWGVNLLTGVGENHLGKLLMEIRALRKGALSDD